MTETGGSRRLVWSGVWIDWVIAARVRVIGCVQSFGIVLAGVAKSESFAGMDRVCGHGSAL